MWKQDEYAKKSGIEYSRYMSRIDDGRLTTTLYRVEVEGAGGRNISLRSRTE